MRRLTTSRAIGLCVLAGALWTPSALAQSDVTQPGDALIPSSTNNPGSEAVGNAIDNQLTKYLNFDAADGTPVGFIVTPGVGLTRVTGIALQSANDAPERDPMDIVLEGSIDANATAWGEGNWEVIYENTAIPDWPTTFPDDDRYQTQTFMFENMKAYRHYRFTVREVQDVASANSMQIAEVELLGAAVPSDVTQPGDALTPSSTNNPGSEAVGNAIDNQLTKYLNFDAADGTPVGFIVTPSIGDTLVTGISLQSANDAIERDPLNILLEGSNDDMVTGWDEGNWSVIYENPAIPAWDTIFPGDDRYQVQTFLFANLSPYKHYRFTVVEVQDVASANSMQIAEVELHGTGAPQDVTQPGDALIPSSTNNPGSEAVGNAIDNQLTKYLNFDAADGTPVGFIVTPSVGDTTVIGITLQSANDAPERDPMNILLEGSNDDTVTAWAEGNWSVIYENAAIPDWPTTFPDDDRYQTQGFFFPNEVSYKHYRFTVLEVQDVASANSMQIAEVELLAVTDQANCEIAAFVTPPVDTPVLQGESATFFTEVNGPWPLQWYKNDEAIPGATQGTYTTDPITAANADDLYTVEIVGCSVSMPVMAVIFTPSDFVSYGVNFIGNGTLPDPELEIPGAPGANGAPTAMAETDIAGFWQQAHWNNLQGSATGEPIVDSNGNSGAVTVTFTSGGTWGSGTGTDSADQRLLNGLVEGNGSITFENVPDGSHTIIVYSVARPLEFPNIDLTVGGTTIYGRQMNSDEYNPSPGFYSITSTDMNNRSVGNMARFDSISPSGGQITLDYADAGGGNSTVNAIQLILDAPDAGEAPAIIQQPVAQNILDGRRATLTVEVTGAEPLSYQWRKDGFTLFDGNGISGAMSPTLTITGFGEMDAGLYDVAVYNAAGTVISSKASLSLWSGQVSDGLVAHWKFDETSGTSAANAAGGSPGMLIDYLSPLWKAGQINNALGFDSFSHVKADDYTKATDALTVSTWVNLDFAPTSGFGQPLVRNWGATEGQFSLVFTDAEPSQLQAQIRVGPNNVTAEVPHTVVTAGEWAHVAMVADGARLVLYVDGLQVASTDYIGNFNNPPMDFVSFGAGLDNDGVLDPNVTLLYGSLDDTGIWTRAISRVEVIGIHEAGEQGEDLSTVVIDIAEEPEITSISVDESGNVVIEFIGTLVHSATVNGEYTPVDGATSPHTAEPGFYQAME